MALAEILDLFMRDNGVKLDEIAQKMGVSVGTVSHWRTGRRTPRNMAQYKQLADLIGVDLNALIDNEVIDDTQIKTIIPTLPQNSDNTQSVAVLDMVAGFGTEGVLDPDFKVIYNIPLPREFIGKISPKYARIIRCLGDSMEPEFSDGDYLLIELLGDRHFIKRAGIYLVRVGEVVYIKRVEFLPNNDVRLISLNPAYGTIQPIKDYGAPYEVLGAVYGKISVKIGASFQFDTQGI